MGGPPNHSAGWWFGTFIYSHSVGKNHTDDTIFFRGVGLNHQPATVISYAPNQL